MKKIPVIFLSIITIICISCFLMAAKDVYAEDITYDKKHLQRVEKLINETYMTVINVLDANYIDMINHPLNNHDLTVFGVYFLYNNRYDKLEKIDDSGKCIIPVKRVHRVVKNILGVHLSHKEIKKQQSDGFQVVDDNIILEPSDPGIYEPLKIKKISRDDISLIRVYATQKDIENNKVRQYKIVLKEKVNKDKLSWNVILIKPVN